MVCAICSLYRNDRQRFPNCLLYIHPRFGLLSTRGSVIRYMIFDILKQTEEPDVSEGWLLMHWKNLVYHSHEVEAQLRRLLTVQPDGSCPMSVARSSAASPSVGALTVAYLLAARVAGGELDRFGSVPDAHTKYSLATLVVNVTENYFFASEATARGHYSLLRASQHGMDALRRILTGYATSLVHILPPGNVGGRCLHYLLRALEWSVPPGVKDALTFVHSLLYQVANEVCLPETALQLLLHQPILQFSSLCTEVNLLDYLNCYYHGALLLIDLRRWTDATECLYNVIALEEGTFFPKQRGRRARDSACSRNNMDPDASHVRCGGCGTCQSSVTLYVQCRKIFLLCFIIAYGGFCHRSVLHALDTSRVPSGVRRSSSPIAEQSEENPHRLPGTYMNLDVLVQVPRCASHEMEPYRQLLRAAMQRDRAKWAVLVSQHDTIWSRDGVMHIVGHASETLRRHLVLDLARVYDTVHLTDVVVATTVRTLDTRTDRPFTAVVSEEQATMQLLREMHVEGHLHCRLEYAEQGAHDAKGWVVHFSMPASVVTSQNSSNYGRDSIAHRIRRAELLQKRIADVVNLAS